MPIPQSHQAVRRQSQVMPVQVLTTTPHCFPRDGQPMPPWTEESGWLAYSLCLFAWCYAVELDEFKSRPWLLPLFVKHCYLEQAGIQRAAWVLRHLEQDQAGWIEGKAILADMDEGSSPTCYVLYWHFCSFLHLLYFILYSGKFKVVIIKWSFLKVSLTLIPTIIIPQQSFMSDFLSQCSSWNSPYPNTLCVLLLSCTQTLYRGIIIMW